MVLMRFENLQVVDKLCNSEQNLTVQFLFPRNIFKTECPNRWFPSQIPRGMASEACGVRVRPVAAPIVGIGISFGVGERSRMQ